MSDVARRAGVSVSTVSYALSGVRPVSEATRQRVQAAMRELDFTPNAVAQGLAGRRTRILALVLPTDEMPVDPFTGEIIVGAAEAARESGHHLLLWTEPASEATELRALLGQRLIDGALVLSVRLDDDRINTLRRNRVPLTMIGRTRDPGDLPYVDTDAQLVAQLAVGHLAALGHLTVGYVGSAQSDPSVGYGFAARLHHELMQSAAEHGMRLVPTFSARSTTAVTGCVRSLFDQAPELSGLLSFGDEMVAGALAGAAAAGRGVPSAVSVIGLLTTDRVANLVHPRATTVSPRPLDLGRRAATMMIEHLDGAGVRQELIRPELVIRDSA